MTVPSQSGVIVRVMKQLAIGLSILLGFSFWAAGAGDAGAATPKKCSTPITARDISYVDEPVSLLQRLDVYGFEDEKGCDPVPVVMYVHGGGWAGGSKNRPEFKPAFFNDLGYVFVSVGYRLSTRGVADHPMHPDHSNDVGAAIAWVEQHIDDYGGNGNQIMLIGHSAGAHLVTLVGLDPTYVERAGGDIGAVKCVISDDTASYDLTQRVLEAPLLIINAFGTDEQVREDASPINHIDDRKRPPELAVVRRGNAVRQAGQTEFINALEAADIDATIIETPGYSHGDVNTRIGEPGETVITPQIEDFTTSCLA